MSACTKCGLPDEIASLGSRGISRWKKDMAKVAAQDSGTSKRERKRIKWGSRAKKSRKHGRPV